MRSFVLAVGRTLLEKGQYNPSGPLVTLNNSNFEFQFPATHF